MLYEWQICFAHYYCTIANWANAGAKVTNLTDFAQMLDKFNEKASSNSAASKFDADKFHGGEAGSFLRNLARDENEAQIYAKLEREAKEAAKMFKKFDFMQMMTKLEMGNLKDGERAEIFAKMNKIAKEI